MQKTLKNLMLFVAVLLLTSCAKTNPEITNCIADHEYGFWSGVWHGMIAPFSFIGMLFNDDIVVWAVNNNGGWYTFGFLLGIGSLSGGSAAATRK